jgi:predicted Zn-dependent protease
MQRSRKDQIITMLESDPNDSFLQYALAIELEKEGNVKDAITALKELKNKDAEYLGLYLKLAQLLAEVNETEKAITVLQEGIQLAQRIGNRKAQGELNELLLGLED